MKHLFLVHSHITFYMALSVIKRLALSSESTVFVFGGNYKNLFHKNISGYSLDAIQTTFSLKKQIAKPVYKFLNKALLSFKVRSWVKQKIGRSFILYTTYFHLTARLLHSHQLCKEVCFIEEGTLNYQDISQNTKPFIFKVFGRLLFWGKLNNFQLTSDKKNVYPRKAYAVHSKAFSAIPGVKTIAIPFFKEPRKLLQLPPAKSCIIVLGNEGFSDSRSDAAYYTAELTKIWIRLFEFASHYKNIYLKTHHFQKEAISKIQKKLLQELKLKVQFIPSDFPLEQAFIHGKNYTVIGIHSSLLMYARILNPKNTVISFANCFSKIIKPSDYFFSFSKEKKSFFSFVDDIEKIVS